MWTSHIAYFHSREHESWKMNYSSRDVTFDRPKRNITKTPNFECLGRWTVPNAQKALPNAPLA